MPRTRMSASSTRSPCGPHAKGPGSVTVNRHDKVSVRGSSAHARPAETNATVWDGATPFGQPLGSGVPSASVAPVGADEGVSDPETLGEEADDAGDPLRVHAPRIRTTASDPRNARMPAG